MRHPRPALGRTAMSARPRLGPAEPPLGSVGPRRGSDREPGQAGTPSSIARECSSAGLNTHSATTNRTSVTISSVCARVVPVWPGAARSTRCSAASSPDWSAPRGRGRGPTGQVERSRRGLVLLGPGTEQRRDLSTPRGEHADHLDTRRQRAGHARARQGAGRDLRASQRAAGRAGEQPRHLHRGRQ